MKKMLYIFIFLIFLKLISSDEKNIDFSLNEILTGLIEKDNSYHFYVLSFKNKIKEDNLLVFTARENRQFLNVEDFIFSDPDIYISRKNKNPKNKKESDWYSETFGNDIITIPSKDLQDIKELYVSLYCEKKCRYKLKAYLTKEIEFKLGSVNSIKLLQQSSISYFLKVNNENYENLKIVAYSPEQKHFHILVSRDDQTPSTQNSYKAIPSWMGGFMVNIKNEIGNFTYHVLLQTEAESTTIKFYAFFQNTFTKIISGEPLMDSMEKDLKRCYYYDMRNNTNNLNEDNLIIQMTLFGGEAFLHITGWNKDINSDINNIKKLENYKFQIVSERSILIKNKDIEIFNKEYDEKKEGLKNRLHFCIYGIQKGSFMLRVNYLNEISSLQKYNYIFPGYEINGFLPENEVTSYKIIDNNINKNSNITISLKNIQGKAILYGYFCDSKNDLYCSFGDYKLKYKLESNEMILSRDQYSSSLLDNTICIESQNNLCYSDQSSKDCSLMAVIKCINPENKICAFSISHTIEDYPILMSPRKTYFNFISSGKKDTYQIIITDIDLDSLVIVLTTNIGDAELSVNQKNKTEGAKNIIPIAISNNEYNLPDVIKITPERLNSKYIVGEFIIKVYSKYFSSYNLYYYTTKSKSKKDKFSDKDITSTLMEGQIIKDYFPSDSNYKIYSYTPGDRTKKDIKITLTRINVRFTFYVFLNLNDIKFNEKVESIYDERIFGYKWVSDSNNEVTISKNDINYRKKGTYYIVVLRDFTSENENLMEETIYDNIIMMYYLGVTKKGLPFYLKEGIEHSLTLNKNYSYQNYIYTHYNFSQPFQFLMNVLNGQLDIFISTKELAENNFIDIYNNIKNSKVKNINLKYKNASIYAQIGINDYASISFNDYNQFNDDIYKNKTIKCDIFIYIYQSQLSLKYERDSQYAITAKTSLNKGSIILSGQVYKNKLKSETEEYFIIEEVKFRDILTITVRFNEGTGDIYAKLIDNNKEIELKKLIFPNSTYFDYKGSSIYMGKMIQIPAKVFEKMGKTILKLKILITIRAKAITRIAPKEIEYYLSYSNEAKRINQNTPYQSSILSGEFQYYTFYFDKTVENILISLSNMNGDADLFLNYGNEKYPTPLESDWHSNSLGHEYIDINKNDIFFKNNKKEDLSGYYTLLVIGYTDTIYTLYISSHDEKIFKLIDNISTNCKCQSKNDRCYFRYDNIADKRDMQRNINIKTTEAIFTSQYLYGNGKMYASILKEQEIYSNENNKKYIDYFPTEKMYEFSNAKFGKRNYLKVIVPESHYSVDSLILMTFICEERTDVEITVAPLVPSGNFKYLLSERENIFYIKYNESLPLKNQSETFLAYYSYKDYETIYEFHAYLGKAKIHIFTNESKWNNVTKNFYYEYNHISEFVIQSKSDENELKEYKYQKYFTEEYFNTIPPKFSKGKTILFSVLPLTNFGFYIQITNDRTWINVPLGKDKSFYIKNKEMYGYFDIFEEFSSVEISVFLKEYQYKRAIIYVKLIIDNKIKKKKDVGDNDKDKLKHYEIPGYNNYDYSAKTDNYLGAMNINIDNIPIIKNELNDTKIVRALFVINIYNKYYTPYGYGNNINKGIIIPENEGQITPFENKFDFFSGGDTKVNILVTPAINNFKRIDTQPYTFYFSNTSLVSSNNKNLNNKIYNGNNEIKIYSLDKISDKDNKMIVQINSCSGDYDIKLSSKVVNYDDNTNDIKYEELSSEYGRKILLIDNLKFKHIYLSIKSKQIENDCSQGLKRDSNNVICSKELSYLLHYYSASNKLYYSAEPDRKLLYREGDNDRQLVIIVPKLKEFDYHNNYRDKKNMEYNLFYTFNRTYSKYLESICYLGHFMEDDKENKNNRITLIKKIHLNDRNEYILDDIDCENPLYINILARNIKNNELILYKPIRGKIRPSKLAKYISIFIALLFILLIIYISLHYYNEENLTAYKLTNSDDIGRDDIKYTNINMSPD